MTCCAGTTPAVEGRKRPPLRLVLAIFLAGNSMVLSLAVNIATLTEIERHWLHGALLVVTLAVALLVGKPLVAAIARARLPKSASIEAVFVAGILGASSYSLHAVWAGTGDIYFEVVCILLVIYAVSTETKQASQLRTLRALRAALPIPQVATCIRPPDSLPRSLPVGEIVTGDHILSRASEIVPVDGVVLRGVAFVNEATLTGEGFCVRRSRGERVRAGTQNIDGELLIRATSDGAACELSVTADQVMQGLSKQSTLEHEADRAARWFFPAVTIISALTFVIWCVCVGFTSAFLNAMAVLLVACPCALGFATPVGLWAAWVKLARLGLVAHHTASIERLAAVDIAVFDKTGTLTSLQKATGACQLLQKDAWTEDEAVGLACVAQVMSGHPIASAFSTCKPVSLASYRPLSVRLLPGAGIEVEVRHASGQHLCVRLGDPGRLADPADAARITAATASVRQDARPLGLFVDGRAVAMFEIVEQPVAGTEAALQRLCAMGLVCAVLSGDITARLQSWSAHTVQGQMSATDKVESVRNLAQQGHRVCFVGDGVNDAPAMAQSYVSLSVDGGAPLARMAADFTLPQAALMHLPEAVAIARKAMRVVRSNLVLAAVYNAVGVALAATGRLHPVFAAVLMLCSSLTVTWRASSWEVPGPQDNDAFSRGLGS